MSPRRFTLADISRKSPAIQAQVAKALWPHQTIVAPRGAPAATKTLPKPKRASRVARTRNGGAWSEARYWQAVRSALRRAFRFWNPAVAALKAARVAHKGSHGQKWAYLCADCGKLFKRKNVQIDHVEPCGALTKPGDIAGFLERLTPEGPDAYKVRCLSCHQKKTNAERGA